MEVEELKKFLEPRTVVRILKHIGIDTERIVIDSDNSNLDNQQGDSVERAIIETYANHYEYRLETSNSMAIIFYATLKSWNILGSNLIKISAP